MASLQTGLPLSHACERRTAKRSAGKESGEEAPNVKKGMVHFVLITLQPSYVAPMYLYVTNVFVYNLYVTLLSV